MKEITFEGRKYRIPNAHSYVATEERGTIYSFMSEPYWAQGGTWFCRGPRRELGFMHSPNWKESLRQYNKQGEQVGL